MSEIIYKVEILTLINNRFGVHTSKLTNKEYKNLLNKLEIKKYITIINEEQDPITIKTDTIYEIKTKIDIQEI